MRHHEEVIPPLHCTACAPCQPIALTQDHSQALAQHCMYQACLEEGKCTPIAAVACATWLASLLLLPRSVNSSYCSNYGNLNQLPCYFMLPSCSSHRKMRMGQSKIFVLWYLSRNLLICACTFIHQSARKSVKRKCQSFSDIKRWSKGESSSIFETKNIVSNRFLEVHAVRRFSLRFINVHRLKNQ